MQRSMSNWPIFTQRVFEVIRTMKMLEESGTKSTNESVAKSYVDKIRLSSDAEAVTRTFVEVALIVFKLFFAGS